MAVCSAMTSSHNRLLYLSLHRNSGFFAVDLEDVTAGWGFPVGSSTFTVVGAALVGIAALPWRRLVDSVVSRLPDSVSPEVPADRDAILSVAQVLQRTIIVLCVTDSGT